MRKRTRLLVFILCLALLLVAASCKKQDGVEGTQPVSKQEDALARYRQACDEIAGASDLTVETELTQSRVVGGETYSEKMSSVAIYQGMGTAGEMASVKQQLAFGPYQTQYAQFYCNGKAYCQTGESTFCAEMTPSDFYAYQIPAMLVDAALYDAVDVDKIFNNTVITFSEPTKLESWATDYPGAVLQSAGATVTLNKAGNLAGATYMAQYVCGTTVYELQVKTTVKLETEQTLSDELAKLPANCPAIACFDAPRKILQVVGDVYTAAAMSAEYTESVYSAAFARSRSQTSRFDTYGAEGDFMARSSYEAVNTDYSNTPATASEVVVFRNGSCISSLNGAEPTAREGITAEMMRTSCEDAILAALFTPNYLKNATLTEKGNQLRIDFTGNDAFADNLCNSIYSIFNANLDTYAQSYTTPKAGGYLCIDRETGLPTAMGIVMERVHVAAEISYSLTYQLDQKMQLSSQVAQENILGAIPQPDTEATESATNP